jgi:hypothetical protein
MEYDLKNDLLIYHYDEKLIEGPNLFELKVKDEKDNVAIYTAEFIY